MKEQPINWTAFKKSKKHMIILFVGGFFAIVGVILFLQALFT